MSSDQKKDARMRVEQVLDEASFIELRRLDESSNVLAGYGTVDNRLVYVCSQYGAVNLAHAEKVVELYTFALRMGAPLITFFDSPGMSLDEGEDILRAYGELFKIKAAASGVIPQISVVAGKCLGVSAYLAALSDFLFMSEKEGLLMLSAPDTLQGMDGKTSTTENFGGFGVHTEITGLACETYKEEADCARLLRELISYLPSNNIEAPACSLNNDDFNRVDDSLKADMSCAEILRSIADNHHFFELRGGFAADVLTAFARFGWNTAAVILFKGQLGPADAEKISMIVRFCDAYRIPIITMSDMEGYKRTRKEQTQMIREGAKLIHNFASAAVPKINLTLRGANGSSQLLLNSGYTGADIHYVWEGAKVSLAGEDSTLDKMAGKGHITDIISPSETRKRLISALEMLSSKRVVTYPKKHGSFAE